MRPVYRSFQKYYQQVFDALQSYQTVHEKYGDLVLEFVRLLSKWDIMANASDADARSFNIFAHMDSVMRNQQKSQKSISSVGLMQAAYVQRLERLLSRLRAIIVTDDMDTLCVQLEKVSLEAEQYCRREHPNMEAWFKRDQQHAIFVADALQGLQSAAADFRKEQLQKISLLDSTLARYLDDDSSRRKLMIRSLAAASAQEDETAAPEATAASNKLGNKRIPAAITGLDFDTLEPYSGSDVYSLFCDDVYIDADKIMSIVQRVDDAANSSQQESDRDLLSAAASKSSSNKKNANSNSNGSSSSSSSNSSVQSSPVSSRSTSRAPTSGRPQS